MRRLLFALGLALGLGILTAAIALADGGPHGGYDKLASGYEGLTDACAACHRAHTAQSSDYLLRANTVFELCTDCHNGTGSRLDVLDGIKLAAGTWPAYADTSGIVTGTTPITMPKLLGGGFDYYNGNEVTSQHPVQRHAGDTAEVGPWGYKNMNTGEMDDMNAYSSQIAEALTCNSCHNPHGSPNYRILRESINDYPVSILSYGPTNTAGTSIGFIKNEYGVRGLTNAGDTAGSDKYVTDYYGSAGLTDSGGSTIADTNLANVNSVTAGSVVTNGIALLCGACHTAYPSPDAMTPLTTTNGTTIVNFRHRTEVSYKAWTGGNKNNGSGYVPCDPSSTTATYSPYYGNEKGNAPLPTPSPNPPCGTPVEPDAASVGTGGLPTLRLAANSVVTGTTRATEIVTCLTCHRAHGTSVTMTGYAVYTGVPGATSSNASNPFQVSPAQETITPDTVTVGGSYNTVLDGARSWAAMTRPNYTTLLFTNNRGMCEACHQW